RRSRIHVEGRVAARPTGRAVRVAIAEASANPFDAAETLDTVVRHCRARAGHPFGDGAEQGPEAHPGPWRVRDVASEEGRAPRIANRVADGARERWETCCRGPAVGRVALGITVAARINVDDRSIAMNVDE